MSEDKKQYYPVEGTVDYWLTKISRQLDDIDLAVFAATKTIKEDIEEIKKIVGR